MPTSFGLGPRYEGLIESLVHGGRYDNATEVIREGLRLVEERERKLAVVDAAIERGLADADAGRVHGIDELRAERSARSRESDRSETK